MRERAGEGAGEDDGAKGVQKLWRKVGRWTGLELSGREQLLIWTEYHSRRAFWRDMCMFIIVDGGRPW